MGQKITYAFGPFRLETDTQLLSYEGTTVGLQPKVYRLLLYFLRHPGRLISREELFEAVWQGTVVEDTALRLAVNSVRKALHDESKTPRYILTACKRGYRFLPDVTVEYGFRGAMHVAGLHYRPAIAHSDTAQEHDAELAQLLDAFEQTTAGQRRLVFLNGERGMGKTVLLEKFLARITHPELAVLRARCVQLGGAAEPFLPLLEALELRCREPCGKSLIDCLHQVAPTWLYQILNVLGPEEITTLHPKVSHITSGRMLREGADFFETLGTGSTFILILDNSQWSDAFTLDLLNFLVFRCSSTRLLMIVSYRSSESGAGARRLEEMREELCRSGLCRELSLHGRQNDK
jgi:DNA-binding winged helix-turn-helix (wHTH) protein